jgi:hypothetical protein
MEARVRLSQGSCDWHTAQSHPMSGMPSDVPVPRNVSAKSDMKRLSINWLGDSFNHESVKWRACRGSIRVFAKFALTQFFEPLPSAAAS